MRPPRSSDALRAGLDRRLYDEKKTVRDDLQITEYTDTQHEPMIPHTTLPTSAAGTPATRSPFHPYGTRSMERTLKEMAGAVDQYAGSATQH